MLPNPLRSRLLAASLTALLAACGTPPADRSDAGERYRFKGGEVALAQRGDECRLTLTGDINQATVASLRLASDDLAKRRCASRWLVLDVPDGQMGAAITLGAMLRNRGFNTRIPAGGTCLTGCLLVFAAGTQREIAAGTPPARLAFSQIPPDEDFGRVGCASELDKRQTLNLARYLRAMVPGPTGDYMLQEIRSTDCRTARELTLRDAVAAGIVTRG